MNQHQPQQPGHHPQWQPPQPGAYTPYGALPPQPPGVKLTTMNTGMKVLCCTVAALLYWLTSISISVLTQYLVQFGFRWREPLSFGEIMLQTSRAVLLQPALPLLSMVVFGLIYAFFVFGPPKWNNFGLQMLAGFVAALLTFILFFAVVTAPLLASVSGGFDAVGPATVSGFIHALIASAIAMTITGFIFRKHWRRRSTVRHPQVAR